MTITPIQIKNRPFGASAAAADVRLLRLPEVLGIYPVGKTKWYAGIKSGLHPRPRKLPGSRTSVWVYDEVIALNELVRDSSS